MIPRAAAAAALVCGLASPALATEWINCAAPDGAASIDLLVGSTEVLSVVGMTITAGEEVWASDVAYGPGEPAIIGQAFEDADTLRLDAVTPDLTTPVAELRLFRSVEGELGPIYGGTLRIVGRGAWAVTCAGP